MIALLKGAKKQIFFLRLCLATTKIGYFIDFSNKTTKNKNNVSLIRNTFSCIIAHCSMINLFTQKIGNFCGFFEEFNQLLALMHVPALKFTNSNRMIHHLNVNNKQKKMKEKHRTKLVFHIIFSLF